jgi:hypothetical protein
MMKRILVPLDGTTVRKEFLAYRRLNALGVFLHARCYHCAVSRIGSQVCGTSGNDAFRRISSKVTPGHPAGS